MKYTVSYMREDFVGQMLDTELFDDLEDAVNFAQNNHGILSMVIEDYTNFEG